jgi:hypothetical protein
MTPPRELDNVDGLVPPQIASKRGTIEPHRNNEDRECRHQNTSIRLHSAMLLMIEGRQGSPGAMDASSRQVIIPDARTIKLTFTTKPVSFLL